MERKFAECAERIKGDAAKRQELFKAFCIAQDLKETLQKEADLLEQYIFDMDIFSMHVRYNMGMEVVENFKTFSNEVGAIPLRFCRVSRRAHVPHYRLASSCRMIF